MTHHSQQSLDSITSGVSVVSIGSAKDGTEVATRIIDKVEKKPGTPRAVESLDPSILAKAEKNIRSQPAPPGSSAGIYKSQDSKSKPALAKNGELPNVEPFDASIFAKPELSPTEQNETDGTKREKSGNGITFFPPSKGDKDKLKDAASKKRVGTIGKPNAKSSDREDSVNSSHSITPAITPKKNAAETSKQSVVEPFDASIFEKPETTQTNSSVAESDVSLRSELSDLFPHDSALAERIANQSISSPTGRFMLALLKEKQKKEEEAAGGEKSFDGSIKSVTSSHSTTTTEAPHKHGKPEEKPLQAGIFQKQFYFGVSHPGADLEPGPWNDAPASSPILQRKLEMSSPPGTYRVQVMTIGNPTGDKDDTRRIKIYEHDTTRNEWDLPLICKQMNDTPEKALITVDDILRNPKTSKKMVDKVLTKANAIKAIAGAQQTLLHVFGSWLNPQLVPTEAGPIEAATDVIYLVDFCPVHGTIARPLKNLPKSATREQVKEAIGNLIPVAVDSAWDHHPDTGFSLAVVVPLGKTVMSYHC